METDLTRGPIRIALAMLAASCLLVSAQNQPVITREGVLLAVDRLMAERWYPDDGKPRPGMTKDQEILQLALMSRIPSLRALGVRSLGRFENPLDVPTISALLQDPDAGVRCEAANAMVMALHNSEGAAVLPGMRALMTPYFEPRQTSGRGGLVVAPPTAGPRCTAGPFEALARLRYDRQTAIEVMKFLFPPTRFDSGQQSTASTGVIRSIDLMPLLLMLRRDPELPLDRDVRLTIERKARPLMDLEPDLNALEILGLLQNSDPNIFGFAARYHCPAPFPPECAWDIRYAGVKGLNPLDPSVAQVLDVARRDFTPEVRMMALRRYASVIGRTKTCEPVAGTVWDEAESTLVRIEAVDLLDARCDERAEVGRRLAIIAAGLGADQNTEAWQLPAHALEALAKFDAAETARIVDQIAIKHAVLFVRAAAARAATVVKDEPALVKLARDADPNVRTEALNGLVVLRSQAVAGIALEDLENADDQVVIAAAKALQGRKDGDTAAPAVIKALERLTTEGRDTSRTARLALLVCIEAWARPDASGASPMPATVDNLEGLLYDFDPVIAAKAQEMIIAVKGTIVRAYPLHRVVDQPTEPELKIEVLPNCAKIVLSSSAIITIELKPAEAPLTVARLGRLVGDRYFAGLPFIYRRRSLEISDLGSPHANDFSGDARFLRDEIGKLRHIRGAVGLSTHGRDTGDMRFFFDLMPQPDFDYTYTVFGQVLGYGPAGPQFSPAPSINGIIEGGTIDSILLSYPPTPCR
jgi:cyclophilin family peptidyl-prolyl cis-trans isomerase/HEAT repeat protein